MADLQPLQRWAEHAIGEQIAAVCTELAAFCERPRSGKRLHRARKGLARLRTALEDLGGLAGATPEVLDRVRRLHRRAGKIRDADVLLERLATYCEKASAREKAEIDLLRRALRKRRRRARRKLESLVRSLPNLKA